MLVRSVRTCKEQSRLVTHVVTEQYLRLVHNLSDREYDYGRPPTKHELLSEAEIRSVERFAVFDSLKQYVFIGGGNKGDGVLRCPAAEEDEQLKIHGGAGGADDDALASKMRDDRY